MTDQTPDPWQDVAKDVVSALAAERAQHQQEVAQRDETVRQLQEQLVAATSLRDQYQQSIAKAGNQIATLTQERDEARKKCADNERGYESLIRRYEHSVSAETARADAAEARCATLQGAVAADEERLRQAAARAGVLFVGCDTADALADRCATLTAALEEAAQDIRDWVKTARGLRERVADADHDPSVPHLRGVRESEEVLSRIYAALAATPQGAPTL